MSNENTRFILAIGLCMGFIFFWNAFVTGPQIAEKSEIDKKLAQQQAEAKKAYGNIAGGEGGEENYTDDADMPSVGKKQARAAKEIVEEGFEAGNRIKIQTDRLHGSINLVGATFDDLTLAQYKVENKNDSPEVTLFSPQDSAEIYYARTGFLGTNTGINTPNKDTVWQVEGGNASKDGSYKITANKPLSLVWDNGAGLVFKKEITIDERYMINVNHFVYNNSQRAVSVIPYGLINRSKSEDKGANTAYISHEGAIAFADEVIHETTYSELQDDNEVLYKSTSGWVALTDKYWLAAILPEDSKTGKFDIREKYYRKNQVNRYQVDVMGEVFEIGAGEKLEYGINIFAGAKKIAFLEDYRDKLNIPLFERVIDFGIFHFLTEPIMSVLNYFYSLLGNFGLAILLLTVCIRLILFPLANKSYKSMARMRKHMPEIQRLKERYKDDKQKQGMEMMKYYREQKISPLSGCLPILIQIPVFFSLYKVLYVTIEMRHAPFYGWLTDLSAKDPTNLLNLFGLIPYAPPEWLPAIGVLPLLFSLTMVLQQKLNPPPTDETQKMVMSFLPWIFLFVFSAFASGLVLYWVWNNILSVLQQWIITKQVDEDKNA